MTAILNKWDGIVNGILDPLNENLSALTEENIYSLIAESAAEQEAVRNLLIEALITEPAIKDKQQYVQLNQSLLIHLLNKLYSYRQQQGISERICYLYNMIGQHLQHTLNYIEDIFGHYFNRNEKVPAFYLIENIEDREVQAKKLDTTLSKADKCLVKIIKENMLPSGINMAKPVTYFQVSYQKELLSELLAEEKLQSTQTIRETLYYFNFNEDNFIAYEYKRLKQLTAELPTKNEIITAFRFEQKSINQLPVKLNNCYSTSMPSLKEQLNGWIDEEVKFLENGHLPEKLAEKENENKIHTTLSVAKLALLIRLLVVDKIIINRTVAPMLRVVAKIFTTLQKEDISFGSIETKYHAPDKATINAVKDMLFKWINILNRL